MGSLIAFITRILTWIVDFASWCIEKAWDLLCVGLAAVLSAIPVPTWLQDAPAVIGAMPASVAYVVQGLHLSEGIAIVVGAYGIRFLIRRIPLIG